MTVSRLATVVFGLVLLCTQVAGAASVTYTFEGTTAAFPASPANPAGIPAHKEAFSFTVPTFLTVPSSGSVLLTNDLLVYPPAIYHSTFIDFDVCTSCSNPAAIFF